MADQLEKESAAALLTFKNGGIKVEDIKAEAAPGEDDGTPPIFGPAALGLQRVGEEMPPRPPAAPGIALNRRGMPARIRKKNRLFFDDDVVTEMSPRASPKRAPKTPTKKSKAVTQTPKKEPKTESTIAMEDIVVTMPPVKLESVEKDGPEGTSMPAFATPELDRKIGQRIGMRLRNMLKLPKAHKWICFEWFYSNIDRPLYDGANDFLICLKESFPQLKTRHLSRVEWCLIRRMMGKPRRCSQSFFDEERSELERKRAKIRLLQQRKAAADASNFQDLPNEIPLQLVIGTKVTARLRKPQDGLFTGSIDAVDTSNNTYRITFERNGLGTHSVPDFEVLSNEPPETVTLTSFLQKFRPRSQVHYVSQPQSDETSTVQQGPVTVKSPPTTITAKGIYGGYPVELLKWIIRLNKILEDKDREIAQLRLMNAEVERLKSRGLPVTESFQKAYAAKVIDLEQINVIIKEKLLLVQNLFSEVSPDIRTASISPAVFLRESMTEAQGEIDHVNVMKHGDCAGMLKRQRSKDLLLKITALLIQIQKIAMDPQRTMLDVKVLEQSMSDIKSSLWPANQRVFQDAVEVHMQQIIFRLNRLQMEKHPFMINTLNKK